MTQYKKDIAMTVAQAAIKAGFRAYLAESNTYGYFTNGVRVVSFQVNYSSPQYSGNYSSACSGTGWQLPDGLAMRDMIESYPPDWITRRDNKIELINQEQHIARYQKSSKYVEVLKADPKGGIDE